jgi:hypothetical protein
VKSREHVTHDKIQESEENENIRGIFDKGRCNLPFIVALFNVRVPFFNIHIFKLIHFSSPLTIEWCFAYANQLPCSIGVESEVSLGTL